MELEGGEEGFEHWNSSEVQQVAIRLFDAPLTLTQDPNSSMHGTTVWDASVVFSKYVEHNPKKFGVAPKYLRGTRVIELGAGCGLSSLAMILRGATVTSTDIPEVVPLLSQNISSNMATWSTSSFARALGEARVSVWDWTQEPEDIEPPYDMVIATDCVFSAILVPHLVACILRCCHSRTQVYVCHEIRDETINDAFREELRRHFTLKRIPLSKLHPKFKNNMIELIYARPLTHTHTDTDAIK